jgi:ubiquinone/menaquinone biosynthesis C-methylase UbiE
MKQEKPIVKAAITYNSAADFYDDAANSFWERFGRKTVERLQLKPGSRVLDVCCGSGASALPAAEIVGPSGFVTAIDLRKSCWSLGERKQPNADYQTLNSAAVTC